MSNEIAILGVGMHPWGKWGHNFVQYGVAAAREALADAGVPWQDITYVSGGATIRCGYPGYVAGATFAQALGWQGAEVNTSYAACASGSQALAAARNKILAGECEVALVVGADTTPKGFLAPAGGYRPDDPDWVRFYLGITNPRISRCMRAAAWICMATRWRTLPPSKSRIRGWAARIRAPVIAKFIRQKTLRHRPWWPTHCV